MRNRSRLAVLLLANIAVALFAVVGSGWLWIRASESTVGPTLAPALPEVVGEVSVPFVPERTRTVERARRLRTRSRRPARRSGSRPVRRVVVTARARRAPSTVVRVRSVTRPKTRQRTRTRTERPKDTRPQPPPPKPPPPEPQPPPPPPVLPANPQPVQPPPPPPSDDDDDDDDGGGDDDDDDDGGGDDDDGGGDGDDDDDGGGDDEDD